jgi:arabinofuranosyltransferase
LDVLILLALALLPLSLVAIVQLGVSPWEDTAMVMRYADHLSAGHGLVWNIGEAPVDGATDFLFTVVVAGLRMAGVGTEFATRAVIVFGWVSTTLLTYVGARRVLGTGPAIAFVAAIPVALGPGILYARAGFGAPFLVCGWRLPAY